MHPSPPLPPLPNPHLGSAAWHFFAIFSPGNILLCILECIKQISLEPQWPDFRLKRSRLVLWSRQAKKAVFVCVCVFWGGGVSLEGKTKSWLWRFILNRWVLKLLHVCCVQKLFGSELLSYESWWYWINCEFYTLLQCKLLRRSCAFFASRCTERNRKTMQIFLLEIHYVKTATRLEKLPQTSFAG